MAFNLRLSLSLLLLCVTFLCGWLHSSQVDAAQPAFHKYNSLVDSQLWLELEPYFLPPDHPIKVRLDYLFQKHRVTLDRHSFQKAGFGKAKMRKATNIVIGRNPWFKGFIFKVYLDSQPPLCEWDNWVKRIEGACAIRQCILRHGFHQFTVPQKWIYPLPEEPSPPMDNRYHRKNFILVAEDMHILSEADNLQAYQKKIDRHLLKQLHCVLTEVGLLDSVYPDNIPFTENGQIAFIDTEHHHHAPGTIPYYKLTHFLSPEMADYWQLLMNGID